jgi:hypothetical protein
MQAPEFQRVLLAAFSINARIKDRNGSPHFEDRLRHFDPFGTEFFVKPGWVNHSL